MSFFNDFDSNEYGGSSEFYRLETGENVIRLLSEPVHMLTVFMGQGIAPLTVKTEKDVPEGKKASHRFLMYVWDYKTLSVKQAEFSVSIINQIADLKKSSQYTFDGELPPYDLIIMKKGEGMDTRYNVTPGRNEDPLPAEVMEELKAKKTCAEIKAERLSDDPNPNATEEDLEKKTK